MDENTIVINCDCRSLFRPTSPKEMTGQGWPLGLTISRPGRLKLRMLKMYFVRKWNENIKRLKNNPAKLAALLEAEK